MRALARTSAARHNLLLVHTHTHTLIFCRDVCVCAQSDANLSGRSGAYVCVSRARMYFIYDEILIDDKHMYSAMCAIYCTQTGAAMKCLNYNINTPLPAASRRVRVRNDLHVCARVCVRANVREPDACRVCQPSLSSYRPSHQPAL